MCKKADAKVAGAQALAPAVDILSDITKDTKPILWQDHRSFMENLGAEATRRGYIPPMSEAEGFMNGKTL